MYKKFFKFLGFLDVPSDIIVGIWSLSILAGCMYSIISTKQVSAPIATIFSVVITNFGAHRVVKIWKGIPSKPAEKNLDIQGE